MALGMLVKKDVCESPIRKIIYPIRIPTPFPVGDVNVYVIKDDKNVLVDTGPKTPEALETLKDGLYRIGLKFKDLDEIWLTHGHPDHFGLVKTIQQESDVIVFGHPDDNINFDYNSQIPYFLSFFREHNLPEQYVSTFITQFHWYGSYLDKIIPDVWFEDDTFMDTGNHRFQILHLPGHAPGHVGFWEETGVLLGGDVLIKHITSNALISFDENSGKRTDNLLLLRNSMQTVGEKAKCVLPGHGIIFKKASEVAESHLEDQEKRLDNVLRFLGEPQSLLRITEQLFPIAEKPEMAFLPISEIIGYLDWGIRVRSMARFKDNGSWFYVKK